MCQPKSANRNYTVTFTVDQAPEEVFDAINNVRGWWSGEIEGETRKLGAEFTYRYRDLHYSRQKITDLVPGKRVAWHVEEAALSFLKEKEGWKGTDIVFDIGEQGDKTKLTFTHVGLVPDIKCYDVCAAFRTLLRGNLRQ